MTAKTTTIERSIVIAAPAARITPLLSDLHRWVEWSPWEGQDPNLQRTYGGEPGAVGSTYAWKGNRKAGAGDMTVTRIAADEVDVDLRFTAPFRSTSVAAFRLADDDQASDSTRVVWTMTSPQNLMAKVMGMFMDMDKLIGGDFEKGLGKLKAAVEH